MSKLFGSWRNVFIVSALAFALAGLVSFLWSRLGQPGWKYPSNLDATMQAILSGTTTAEAAQKEPSSWRVYIYNFHRDSATVVWQSVDQAFLFQALDTASFKLLEQEVHVYPNGDGFSVSLYGLSDWVSGESGDWLYVVVVDLSASQQRVVLLRYDGKDWFYAFPPSA